MLDEGFNRGDRKAFGEPLLAVEESERDEEEPQVDPEEEDGGSPSCSDADD